LVHLPTVRINKSLRDLIHDRFGDAAYASEEEGAVAISSLLAAQSATTITDERTMYEQLATILRSAREALPRETPHLTRRLEALELRISGLELDRRWDSVERQEKALLRELEELVEIISAEPALGGEENWRDVTFQIAQWDIARINRFASPPDVVESETDTELTKDKLVDYLRSRFEDPNIEIVDFSRGTGGYGKETIFFESTGKVSGKFVLRRDLPVAAVDNDCHRVVNEYPVIKAAKEAGFPAPDALWLETGHPLLPGADFFVMRRSPGKPKGTVFGGAEKLGPGMVTTFAQVVGRLHTLDPLTGVGDLTDSIRTELWSLPVDEVVRRYIRGYYEYFLGDRVSVVPSLVAAYQWLLANIPECKEPPVLVHGDLGLQNLLFEDDALSAVFDWEYAHVGDPMEEIAYIRDTSNTALDWELFTRTYEEQSGIKIDLERVRFQQVWGKVRNVTGSVLCADRYASGGSQQLKLAHIGFSYYPWLGEAMTMIKEG
jgi:aminoglycoside phosphotransferase (APT) family kinase protein